MERYFEKITNCMMGVQVQVDDETYTAVEGLRAVYAIVEGNEKVIVDGACAFQFEGEMFGGEFGVKVCDMNHRNRLSMNRHFKYTVPDILDQTFNRPALRSDICESRRIVADLKKGNKPSVCIHQRHLKDRGELTVCLDEISWLIFKSGNKDGYTVILDDIKDYGTA